MTDAELSISDATLIARLREIQGQAGLFASVAADRIEQLVATNEALIAERDEALEWLSASQGYIADAVYALDKQETAEAKLAKAVGLLMEIEAHLKRISGFFFDTFPRKEIKATLAEIKKPITEWPEETGNIMVGEMKGDSYE